MTTAGGPQSPTVHSPEPEYKLVELESPFFLVSLIRQIVERLREPKLTVPEKYYRGEASLPVVEMRSWYRDLPDQLRAFFEPSSHPIDIFNRAQEKRRALVAVIVAFAAAAGGWFAKGDRGLVLGLIAGAAVGRLVAGLCFKKRQYPPDIWQDYRMQRASWINSLLVHAVALAALILPFYIARMFKPVEASKKHEVSVLISPYVPPLAGPDKRMGGGGGGGDRSPTPASKGAIPRFSRQQLAPPMAKLPNLTPKLPVEATLLGPPKLDLPEMKSNVPWGDPNGVPGPPSNGPGTGGGIGTGSGGGVGEGNGRGLGPGDDAGTGGGPYSVGGGVSAPIPIYQPEPPYSEEARKAKYQGVVVLWVTIDAQGNVTDARVVKPLGLGLDEKAVETVRTWRFKPAMRNSAPVPVRVSVEVTFRLF
jgi:protein TonB